MSEEGTGRGGRQRSPGEDEQRARTARSFLASTVCVLGILLALGGFVAPFVTGPALGASVALQAVGLGLGVLGYYLGARRLAIVTIILSVLAIFFGLAASQGLIPGFEAYDRGIPGQEPGSQRPDSE